jgi:hypothetical protein
LLSRSWPRQFAGLLLSFVNSAVAHSVQVPTIVAIDAAAPSKVAPRTTNDACPGGDLTRRIKD